MKQMMMMTMGEATGGPTSSTLREGQGKSLGEVCAMNKDELKKKWFCAKSICLETSWVLLTADSLANTRHSMHLN